MSHGREDEILRRGIGRIQGNHPKQARKGPQGLRPAQEHYNPEGAATLSKEESGKLAQRQLKFIQHLEAALVRIENKTYGICRETGKLISKERLRVVPHATLSIDAKNNQK